MQRRQSNQSGFSLIELMFVFLLFSFVMAVIFGVSGLAQAALRMTASRAAIIQNNRILFNDLQETCASTGLGAENTTADRIIATTAEDKVPAAFVGGEDGNRLTVVMLNKTGATRIIPGSPRGKIFLDSAPWSRWSPIPAYSYCMVVNPTGPPAILQLTEPPRKPAAGEIPIESGVYNGERAIVLTVSTPSEFFGLKPLTGTLDPLARIIPITGVVRYFVDERGGISRDEYVTENRDIARPTATGYIHANMSPGMNARLTFSYWTTNGYFKRLPDDVVTLRGIRINVSVTDPTTNYTAEDTYDAPVEAWQ